MRKFIGFCLLVLGSIGVAYGHEEKDNNIRVYILDCGTIAVSDMDAFSSSGDYAKIQKTLSSSCYLIRHEKGDLIWDTGLPTALFGKKPTVNGVFTVSLEKTMHQQLKEIDVDPLEIKYISVSHSHFDHVGQISSFPKSTWLVNDKEEKAMFSTEEKSKIYVDFKNLKRKVFKGDYDVFGDGSVMILDMPGHTEGHTVLKVKLKKTGIILLSGDLYHQIKSRELKRVPKFNYDEKVTRKSMKKFEEIVKSTNAKVIIQHDRRDIDNLPKLPNYLD